MGGLPDDNEALLVERMSLVVNGGPEWIGEDGDGFIEGDAVLFEVGGGFGRVELEAQRGEVHALVVGAILARAGAAGACARCPHLRIGIWGARF